MPMCHLFTNVAASALREGIEMRIAKVVASTLKKPMERITVVVVPGVHVCRNGTTDPACTFNIQSIGVFDKEKNPSYTKPFMDVLTNELTIPKDRVAIVYEDLMKEFVGWPQ